MAKRRTIVPIWITRDDEELDDEELCGDYTAFASPLEPTKDKGGTWRSECTLGKWLCAGDYEHATPKSLHLKPGGGPIKVKLVKA